MLLKRDFEIEHIYLKECLHSASVLETDKNDYKMSYK